MRVLLAAILALSLAACQPDGAVGPDASAYFTLKDPSVTSLHSRMAADSTTRHLITRDGIIAAMRTTDDAVRMHDRWQDQHRALQSFLSQPYPDASVQSWREIMVASSFPPGHLINEEPVTREKQEAIAFYATLLIENHQLGGDKVTNALDRLEGYWPAPKLIKARQLVDDAALHAGQLTPP